MDVGLSRQWPGWLAHTAGPLVRWLAIGKLLNSCVGREGGRAGGREGGRVEHSGVIKRFPRSALETDRKIIGLGPAWWR